MEAAGFRTVGMIENNLECQALLQKRFPGVPIHGDIATFNASNLRGKIHAVTGGFPCQPFSTAGHRKGKADSRFLWPEMLRIVTECRPMFVVAENVPGILTLGISDYTSQLADAGYEVWPFVIPASAVGASHRRKRVLLVASYAQGGNWDAPDFTASSKWAAWPIGTGDSQGTGLSGIGTGDWRKWVSKPAIRRSDDGFSSRVDRLKQLGNAISPAWFYPIAEVLAHGVKERFKEIERGFR